MTRSLAALSTVNNMFVACEAKTNCPTPMVGYSPRRLLRFGKAFKGEVGQRTEVPITRGGGRKTKGSTRRDNYTAEEVDNAPSIEPLSNQNPELQSNRGKRGWEGNTKLAVNRRGRLDGTAVRVDLIGRVFALRVMPLGSRKRGVPCVVWCDVRESARVRCGHGRIRLETGRATKGEPVCMPWLELSDDCSWHVLAKNLAERGESCVGEPHATLADRQHGDTCVCEPGILTSFFVSPAFRIRGTSMTREQGG